MSNFQSIFNKRVDGEYKRLNKALPFSTSNDFSASYWKGWTVAIFRYAEECNMPDDVFKRQLLLIENEITSTPKDNPLKFYWGGYKSAFAFSRRLYIVYVEDCIKNDTYVKTEYIPRKRNPNPVIGGDDCPY